MTLQGVPSSNFVLLRLRVHGFTNQVKEAQRLLWRLDNTRSQDFEEWLLGECARHLPAAACLLPPFALQHVLTYAFTVCPLQLVPLCTLLRLPCHCKPLRCSPCWVLTPK